MPRFSALCALWIGTICAFAFGAAAQAQWQHKLVGPTSLAFSPDGKTLATGNIEGWLSPGDLRLWRVSDGKLLHRQRYVYGVDGVAFSPDGKTLAMTTVVEESKNPIRLWDVASWRAKSVLGGDQFLSSIDHSPDGKRLVVGSNMGENGEADAAYVWNLAQKRSRVLPQSDGSGDVVWSARGDLLLGNYTDMEANNNLRAWSAAGKLLWQQGQSYTSDIAWLPDGRAFLVGIGAPYDPATFGPRKQPGTLQIRDAATGRLLRALKQSVPINAVAVSSNGKVWASGGTDGSVRLWNAQMRRVTRTIKPHRGTINVLKFSPDGRFLASSSYDDNTIRVMALAAKK